jgi:hypothetical protein
MSLIQITDIAQPDSEVRSLSSIETQEIAGGKRGGNGRGRRSSGGDFDGGYVDGGEYPFPVPVPVSSGADPFIFDEIGPGNSRRDRFVVSPNGDVFQFNRKGNSKRSFTYNPGFARGGFGF